MDFLSPSYDGDRRLGTLDISHEQRYLPWKEFSKAEEALALQIKSVIDEFEVDDTTLITLMRSLAMQLANELELLPQEIKKIWSRLPISEIVTKTDTTFPFAQHDDHVTPSFLACFISKIWGRNRDLSIDGVVGTPPILAADMAKLALHAHQDNLTLVSNPEVELNLNRENIAKIHWYDPCIGAGVFSVAITDLLIRLGVPTSDDRIYHVYGRDINLLGVECTRLRVSLLISKSSESSFTEIYKNIANQFTTEDSLITTSESLSGPSCSIFQSNGSMHGYDIVIGNPPYVRSNKIPKDLKSKLKRYYPLTFNGVTDLYHYFIVHGLSSIKSKGILFYVTPSSILRSLSLKNSRGFISEMGNLELLFDFDELPVFQNFDVNTCAYLIRKDTKQKNFLSYTFSNLPNKNPLIEGLIGSNLLPGTNITAERWLTHGYEIENLLRDIIDRSVPLETYSKEILSGIKTGCKDAFFLKSSETAELSRDPLSKKYLKRMLLPKSIRKWHIDWGGTHIALVKKGENIPAASALMKRFEHFEGKLRKRSDVKGHPTWYGLRNCIYYEVFDQPKIIFPDISTECRFAMDLEGFIVPDGAFILPVQDYFLLGLLNSSIGEMYFRMRCNSIGSSSTRGRMRFKKAYVSSFPVPIIERHNIYLRDEIATLARNLSEGMVGLNEEKRINDLVFELYGIDKDIWERVISEKSSNT